MTSSRLFEIIYILLEKKKVTAPELAERFEVSVRTIYRDIDALSSAGIPVYCTQGKGGGIGLLEDFVMDRSALTEKEQSQILLSLQCMAVTEHMDAQNLLSRLSSLFQKDNENWVYVDFSRWNTKGEKELFEMLKEAVLNREVIRFDYYNARGEHSRREAEPMQLYFRGMDWYLVAFCKKSSEIRIFKLKRLKNLEKTEQHFLRKELSQAETVPPLEIHNDLSVTVRVDKNLGFRVYDEFEPEWIQEKEGFFYITVPCSREEWLYGWLLSFGPGLEVLEPEEVRCGIKKRLECMLGQYKEKI
ncbi:helix-turn-helix transcriptional regulator [Anaerostipes sp.]|uniref:helix-turn-helix transcriptional regulator n=1 Tax=Anaerostipes sp. TaxID=1872530 RepID=UPI0025C53683|nr:YafY family protein [Anaerostipes sp.]MBS7007806.1 YafY family transcriptional regulator [Anaerostipes sp.]